jgi:hypothetical protein
LLEEQEIRRLLLATAARDVDAFARLYKRCAPLLLGVAQRITRRRELAEEGAAPSVVAAVSADRDGARVASLRTLDTDGQG